MFRTYMHVSLLHRKHDFSNLSSRSSITKSCMDALFIIVMYKILLDCEKTFLSPHITNQVCSRIREII